MGSFCVACSVSHLSIDPGDPILFLPLMPARFSDGLNHRMLISNSGPAYFFEPLTLPIRGVYDDYGYMGEIVEDANTEAIERYYGISIEEFVNYDQFREGTGKISMFMHQPIYDFMVKFNPPQHTVASVKKSFGVSEMDALFIRNGMTALHYDRHRFIERLLFKDLLTDEEGDRISSLYDLGGTVSEEIVQQMIDFNCFARTCYLNNVVWMPWAQHTQYGELKEQLTIYDEYVRIIHEKYERYAEEMRQYDDEE